MNKIVFKLFEIKFMLFINIDDSWVFLGVKFILKLLKFDIF